MEYVNAFLCGGLLCAVGQILVDKTRLTPARILTGFGYSLAKGVADAVARDGLMGVLTGGLTAASGGITAAVVFSLLASLLVRPSDKRRR